MEPTTSFNPFDELLAFEEPKAEEKAALIARLASGDYSLSFSRLVAFSVSPYHFISYKVAERKGTPAMLMGEVVHCRVLEPELFDKRYRIAPTVNAATTEGKKAWASIFEEMTGEELARNKQDNPIIPKIADLIDAIKAKTGVTVLPGAVAEQGDFRARRLLQNRASRYIIDQITQTEASVEVEHSGVKIKGRVDGYGPNLIMDIKNMPNAEIRAASFTIKSRKLHWQAWAYSSALGIKKHYVVCVDGNGEVSVHLIPERMIEQAEIEVYEYIDRFKDLAVEGGFDASVWDQSQDFWLANEQNPYGINFMS